MIGQIIKTDTRSGFSTEPAEEQMRVVPHTAKEAIGANLADQEMNTFVDPQPKTTREKDRQIPLWKRILDLTIVFLTMPFWLTLMVLATLWIKAVSPGPTFYRQERIGYRGRKFMIWKFRSMKVNVETKTHEKHLERLMSTDSPMTKLDAVGDPRVIPLGWIIRATCLDELPQIFNVLLGEMSLVGPRPCTTHEFEMYRGRHHERVNAPPGLTGFWQVHGKNKTTFNEMIAMDIHYAENMSLALDVSIILKTVPSIVSQILESRARASILTTDQPAIIEKRRC